jgi:CheY-like chemotaxis protein
VLWVDDHPSNNYYKRKALELLGIHFTISTSTADALEKASKHKYDVIISDMQHPFDQLVASSLPGTSIVSSPPDEWAISSPPVEEITFGPLDEHGAYTLLEELQKRDINTPFIIHSLSNAEKKAYARRRGAFGFTGNAETLFRMVIDAILSTQSS